MLPVGQAGRVCKTTRIMIAEQQPRLLLTTVFRPYGVRTRDAGAVGMQMELLNNQITREQGVHSPRANFWTFPLYFLAENVHVPATVLDFPSWRDFTRELKQGYTHVGLSFIQTNVLKVKRMAEYIRRRHADIKIILGGYGTALPDLRELVPHDAVCHGEGIHWLRRFFGEDPSRPITHPVMHGVVQKHIYGTPCPCRDSAVIFPGLGCANGCFFCSTSSKFGGRYVPFLSTGKAVADACDRARHELGVSEFAVIDENFLKDTKRARDLLAELERRGRTYNFFVFASAEVLTELGVDFLVRLGVVGVWMGVETRSGIFAKLEKADPAGLIAGLQARGVSVISSSILFMEHHDGESLPEDIDWAIGLGSDLHQFMQLTPLPGTPLYETYAKDNRLIREFPYTRMSGQDVLNFWHPHFESGEAHAITRRAFRRKYEADGPGVVNMAWTAVRGYEAAVRDKAARQRECLGWNPETLRYDRKVRDAEDPYMEQRIAMLRQRAMEFRPLTLAAQLFAPNRAARRKCRELRTRYRSLFGRDGTAGRLTSLVLAGNASLEQVRLGLRRLCGVHEMVRQPPARRVEYRHGSEREACGTRHRNRAKVRGNIRAGKSLSEACGRGS